MKYIIYPLSILLTVCFLAGCSASVTGKTDTDNYGLNIVATIFPEYDWVRTVLGDNPGNAELTMLLDNGVDLHSYQPTADDILKISTCDLFIYVGGESDEWVNDILNEASNPNMKVINLLDVLGENVKEEELVEGMQDVEEESSEEEETEYDEHVWLSLRNAEVIVASIADSLGNIDTVNSQTYHDNAGAYIEKLKELDKKYEAVIDEAPVKTLIFGDRFPFRYLVEDYGLNYYAAFAGCSAETEASFNTIVFLAEKADELELGSVLTIEGDDTKIANTICENTKDEKKILTLNSMQSVTSKDAENGITYLSVMEDNLSVLKEALY